MRVLLTSPRAPVTLDLARRLNASGIEVFLCDSLRFGCSRFTNSKKGFYRTPPAKKDSDQYVSAINRIIKAEKIDLLIPTCEEIFYLAAAADRLECDVFSDSLERLNRLHNKWTFAEAAMCGAGRAPESFRIDSRQRLFDFRSCCNEFVFKPIYSRFASETLLRPSAQELDKIEVSPERPWLAQRYVGGTEYSTYSVAQQGKLVAHCSYRSSFRAGVGAGICFFTDPHSKITDFTRQLIQKTEFTGQLGLDCILDKEGIVWPIECNPRATSGLHLFDEGPMLVESVLGRNDTFREAKNDCRYMVGAAMLTFALPSAIRQGKLKAFVHDIFSSKEVLFQWSDPIPFLSIPLSVGELCWIAIHENISIQEATTHDIEWNGQQIPTTNTWRIGKGT